MAKGTVKWFDPKKGFGFVVNESGEDVFVHYSSIHAEGFRCLRSGQRVEYHPIQTPKGLKDRTVQLLPQTDSGHTTTSDRQRSPSD